MFRMLKEKQIFQKEVKQLSRLPWHSYFLNIAQIASSRSTCFSPPKGAVIVVNKNIIATGYNGAPRGIKDCKYDIKKCRKRDLGFEHGTGHHECLATHAEANAIVQAARTGAKTEGATLYCTHQPCPDCAKLIINAGIAEVYWTEDYPSNSTELFKQARIKAHRYHGEALLEGEE